MYRDDKKIVDIIEHLDVKGFEEIFTIKKDEKTSKEPFDLDKNDGFIEIRGHQLFVINPKEGGRYPVLVPNPSLQIIVNDRTIKSEVVVTSKDEIKVNRISKRDPYNITISDDKITMFLHLDMELFQKYRLKDCRRSNRLMLELE